MQCLHFKGTKCVFDRENAVATCSKWPELQITPNKRNSPHILCWSTQRSEQQNETKKMNSKIKQNLICFFTSGKPKDVLWSGSVVQGPNGAKECCCCMLICHEYRFRWVSQNIGSRTLPYLYLSIVYESQVWVLSDSHPKAWCSRSGSRFEVWLYTEWLCEL